MTKQKAIYNVVVAGGDRSTQLWLFSILFCFCLLAKMPVSHQKVQYCLVLTSI